MFRFWLRWFPWRFILRRLALQHGLVDPVSFFASLSRFAQPSEVAAPFELLRAAVVFHGRGLLNTQSIQNNLDWVWPYWVNRQFDPADDSFVPRGFSITHVNLTHRNWTALALPGSEELVVVDPRGLIMPFWDSWSLDAWITDETGRELLPCASLTAKQFFRLEPVPTVTTEVADGALSLKSEVSVVAGEEYPVCCVRYEALSGELPASFALSARPYNPEGVSLIHHIECQPDRAGWVVNSQDQVLFAPPARHLFSCYRTGDVHRLHERELLDELEAPSEEDRVKCEAGMATSLALYNLRPTRPYVLEVKIPLARQTITDRIARRVSDSIGYEVRRRRTKLLREDQLWREALLGTAALDCPDERIKYLYDAALRALVVHVPRGTVYPGPYTYKRFWFRDAAYILHALLCAGLSEPVKLVLKTYPRRQRRDGYFLSQDGEWDANGEALWIIDRASRILLQKPGLELLEAVRRGAAWIDRKRRAALSEVSRHRGLLPPGFSAEHFGPNDYYYWDDFWGVAGLRAGAKLLERCGQTADAGRFEKAADELFGAIESSLQQVNADQPEPRIPASPYRRMDAGAIGALCAAYPLRLYAPRDQRMLNTVDALIKRCFFRDAFFQDMIHSGLNAYLTLHAAQVLLRAGDPRFMRYVESVRDLASDTGQWPEAVHPKTLGGCMGDGQHIWAAADWVMMLRNMFVREEDEEIILLSGVPMGWLKPGSRASYGPTATEFGKISVRALGREDGGVDVQWKLEHDPACHSPLFGITLALEPFGTRRLEGFEGTVGLNIEDMER